MVVVVVGATDVGRRHARGRRQPWSSSVDVVEDGAARRASCEPCSSAAPTGTSVLTKTALMAAAAPMGAATQERQRFSAPRRIGISTRS